MLAGMLAGPLAEVLAVPFAWLLAGVLAGPFTRPFAGLLQEDMLAMRVVLIRGELTDEKSDRGRRWETIC